MAVTIQSVTKQVSADVPKVRTGILQSYSGYLAQVAIDGNVLSLPMMDHVSTTIPVGSTVVCQVFGSTGYVIGSVNTVSRASSVTWTGGFGNPPVPRPSNAGVTFSTFSPVSGWSWSGASRFTTFLGQGSLRVGAWAYGANAFTGLSGRTIKSVEVYLPALLNTGDAYPLNFQYHTSATLSTTTAPTLLGTVQTVSSGGWVTLSAGFVTAFGSNLSAFGLGISGNPTAAISSAAPFGTLRIGWSN